jgi:CO/xanthine dehydrogenase FAD-binding subunit
MEYLVAGSVEEALRMVDGPIAAGGRRARYVARYVAGGTDLAVQMQQAGGGGTAGGLPDTLVDVSGIPELLRLEREPGSGRLRIGAAVRLETLARRTDLPACLVQGARAIGSPQIRALGTLGGNLCNASPCGDTLAPVIALGGRLVLASLEGRREVPAEEFFTGPKATVLGPGELLVEVLVDPEALAGRSAFRMIGQREGQAISQVNVAVWLRVGSGRVAEIRAAAGSVAPTPVRLAAAERVAHGRVWSDEMGREAGQAAAAEVRPIDDVRAPAAYRRLLTAALLREALAEAWMAGVQLEAALLEAAPERARSRPETGGGGD